MKALGVWLWKHARNVQEIWLDDNDEIGSKGVIILAPYLAKLPRLRFLSLSACEIKSNGAISLAR